MMQGLGSRCSGIDCGWNWEMFRDRRVDSRRGGVEKPDVARAVCLWRCSGGEFLEPTCRYPNLLFPFRLRRMLSFSSQIMLFAAVHLHFHLHISRSCTLSSRSSGSGDVGRPGPERCGLEAEMGPLPAICLSLHPASGFLCQRKRSKAQPS